MERFRRKPPFRSRPPPPALPPRSDGLILEMTVNRSFNETPVELLKWILLIAFIVDFGVLRAGQIRLSAEEEADNVAFRHKTINF